jgi:hypothetical protein
MLQRQLVCAVAGGVGDGLHQLVGLPGALDVALLVRHLGQEEPIQSGLVGRMTSSTSSAGSPWPVST